MSADHDPAFLLRNGQQPGWFARLIGALLAAAMVVLGFMFSVVAFIAVAIAGMAAAAWFWWKTRKLRRQLRDAAAYSGPVYDNAPGDIIEGEAVRMDDRPAGSRSLLK